MRFERALDPDSVLTAEASKTNQLAGAVRVYFSNGLGGNMTDLKRRVFVGGTELSGIPFDLAFDDPRNLAGLENDHTAFSAGLPLESNGKNLVRSVAGVVHNTNEASYLFTCASSAGARIDSDAFQPGLPSIALPGARGLMSYFRQ